MERISFLILTSLLITSCTFIVPYETRKSFTYCYDGKNTGLDTLINIDGIYYPIFIDRSDGKDTFHLQDTLFPSYAFYNNGFTIAELNKNILDTSRSSNLAKRWGWDYGRYIVCDDTIKLQYIPPPGGITREMGEVWFKIIDRHTLKKIYQGSGKDVTAEKLPPLHPYLEEIFIFSPLKIKITPEDTWIIKKKWFWCKDK